MTKGLFSTLFISGLDNTLFQSKWMDSTGLYPMSRSVSGDPQGYATGAQAELWDAMRHEAFCVGVSARNFEQICRVDGWDPIHEHQLMLIDHGMTLLYRNIFKDEGWAPIEGWSLPYIEMANRNAAALKKEGTELSFELTKHMPDLVTVHNSKLVYSTLPGFNNTNVFYSVRAGALYSHALVNNDMAPLNKLRSLLHRHVSTSELPLTYFEIDGTFSLLPGWFSKKTAIQRLIAMLDSPEPGLDDPRLNAAIRAIGKPKLILTAGARPDDVEFMSLGHFMLTPTKSTITKNLVEQQSEIPLLTDIV